MSIESPSQPKVEQAPQPIILPEEIIEVEAKKKPRKGPVIGAISGLAGLAIGIASFVGINSLNEEKEGPIKEEPVATAPVAPGEEEPVVNTPETPVSGELLPADMDLEIPAGLTSEELGQVFIDRYNAWGDAGSNNKAIATEKTVSGTQNVSMGDFVTGKAQEFAPYFADALFVADWRDRPDLVSDYEASTIINAHRLELNLKTNDPVFGDEEAWEYKSTLNEVREISSDGESRVLEIDFTDSNNADKNRVGETFGLEDAVITVPYGTWTVGFEVVDGVERIASLSVTSRQP